jgi:phosphatidylinositol-3-phosphatase
VRRFCILLALAMVAFSACGATVWARAGTTAGGSGAGWAHTLTGRHHKLRLHHNHRKHHKRRKHKPHRHRQNLPVAPAPSAGAGAASGSGMIQHVVWILMENKDYSSIIGSGSAPYITSLANAYGVATNYSAISHPSLPNYIALTSGSDQGISDDSGPSSHRLSVPNIFSQLPGGGSRSLEESMPSPCDQSDSGSYAVRHDPEAYYSNLGPDCQNYDVPFGAAPDISARFTFVTPNLVDDMHDGTISDGDKFLNGYVPALLATPQYQAGDTVIFITWDENGGSSANQVPCIVISPSTHGVRDATPYNHYSLLRTTEELLGLPLLGNAASANSMVAGFGL